MGNSSKFSPEEKEFIIQQFEAKKKATAVKREFRKKFGSPYRVSKISPACFESVYKTFRNNGLKAVGVKEKGSKANHKPNEATTSKVKDLYDEGTVSVREASRKLEVPRSTVHWHLKEQLDMQHFKVGISYSSAKISLHMVELEFYLFCDKSAFGTQLFDEPTSYKSHEITSRC